MQTRARWIGGLGIAVVVSWAVASLASREDIAWPWKKKQDKPEPTLEFSQREVVQPQSAVMPVVVSFSGPLVAPNTAVVRAKAGGTLLSLDVAEGSRVSAGQRLGTLDLAELNMRWAERNAMVESARTQVHQAERTHESNERLAAQQFISPIALENSRAALEAARAQLRAAQAQADTVNVTKRHAALVSPIAGVVAKRHVVPGEKLSPEQQVLTIVDLARLELAGSIGTHEVSLLSPGMPVQVQVEGVARQVTGTLARIAPAAEAGSRSIGVTIELDNPKEAFRAGQYALARVTLDDPVQRLTLPTAAIVNVTGQDHVWVIERTAADGNGGGSSQLVRRAVTTGRRDDVAGRVEIVSGLNADARVLAARFDNLREGRSAVVNDVGGPASAAASAARMASAAASSNIK